MVINDTRRFRRLAMEGGWIVTGQIASVAGALVLVRVITEYLTPTQYGQLALGLTAASLVNQVVMGGITNGIIRFYSISVEKQDLSGYLQASQKVLGYATLIILAIGLVLLGGLLWLGYSQWMGLAAAAIVFSVLSGYNSSLNGIQNAARQRAIVAFHGGLDAWLKILLAVSVMFWLGTSSTTVVIGYACSCLLVTLSQLGFLCRTIPVQHTRTTKRTPWMRQMWAYSWPFSAWGIFTWMQLASDRWVLQVFTTIEEVGLYAVLFQLGYTPIAMVTGMAMTFVEPILYQRTGDATDHLRNANVYRLCWRITHMIMMVTLIGFGLTFTTHEWIFRLLVAEGYCRSSYLLPWILLAGGIFAAGQMLALILMSNMKSATMTSAKIATALMGVLFNVIGASLLGLNGVIVALIAFSIIYFIWMAILSHRRSMVLC
jgi:O-antigen/teichoic acid export membrane protein